MWLVVVHLDYSVSSGPYFEFWDWDWRWTINIPIVNLLTAWYWHIIDPQLTWNRPTIEAINISFTCDWSYSKTLGPHPPLYSELLLTPPTSSNLLLTSPLVLFLVFRPLYWHWKVYGWVMHLDYNVSSGPFLCFDLGDWDWRWTRTRAWQLVII